MQRRAYKIVYGRYVLQVVFDVHMFIAKRQALERQKNFLDGRPNYCRAVEENNELREGLAEAERTIEAAQAQQRSNVAKGSCMWMH